MSARVTRSSILLGVLVGAGFVVGILAPRQVVALEIADPNRASEARLTGLTNESRVEGRLAPLDVDPGLASIARWRSEDMAERDYFSHEIPGGTKVFDEMAARGYCSVVAGENIGWLAGPDIDSEARIQEMFLDSPKHRSLILGRAWNVIGIGSYTRADGRHYWTVLFAESCREAG